MLRPDRDRTNTLRRTIVIIYAVHLGESPFHEYATNTLSWTCRVKDGNEVANKPNDFVAPPLAPPANTREYVLDIVGLQVERLSKYNVK